MSSSATHTERVFTNATRLILYAMVVLSCGAAIYLLDREIAVTLVPDRLAEFTLAVPLFGNLGYAGDLLAAALGAVAAWLTIYGSSRERRQNDKVYLE